MENMYKLKNAVKNILAINSYVNERFYSFAGRNTGMLDKIVNEFKSLDYYKDITSLKQFQYDVSSGEKCFFTYDPNWSNMHIYGIWNALFGQYYQGDICRFPAVEHGLIFHEDIFTDLRGTARCSCVTFSEFRKKIIQSKRKLPVFCVGPYIHYCDSFYSNEEMKKMKMKLGKTLLVFPTHSTDSAELNVNQEAFLRKVQNYSQNYDSVLVNVFWWNINDPLVKRMENEGYKIVSCGFRDDISFLKRLKSYIMLSDLVIGDGVGTHIGYCYHCNVPFVYLSIGTEVKIVISEEAKDLEKVNYHSNIIKSAFSEDSLDQSKQKKVCEYYWGENQLKSKDDLKLIVEISNDLAELTHGFTALTYKKSTQLLKRYKKSNKRKYNLLKYAL